MKWAVTLDPEQWSLKLIFGLAGHDVSTLFAGSQPPLDFAPQPI
jgi:hypothetical protein